MEYSGAVRIGNWQERAVCDKLGKFDYKDRSTQILTGKRVIEHDDQVAPKDYSSTLRDTYPDPKTYPGYQPVNPQGPRQKAVAARLKAQIDAEFAEKARIKKEEESKRDLQSTSRANMAASGFVPEDRRERASNFETKNADYATETAITYYTHTLETSKEGLNFPITLVTDLKKPWTKVSQVSEGNLILLFPFCYYFPNVYCNIDLGNGTRRIRENWEHPHPLPSLAETKILQGIRENLLSAVPGDGLPGSRVREIFLFLLKFETEIPALERNSKGWIYVEDISGPLNETYGVAWSKAEILALLRAYDHDRCYNVRSGRMRIREFMDLIRSPLTPRKQEIVEIVFNIIDNSGTGFITVDDIVNRWQGPERMLNNLLHSLEVYNGYGPANLMQSVELREDSYCCRVFALFYKDYVTDMGDNTEDFEQFIEECWRLD